MRELVTSCFGSVLCTCLSCLSRLFELLVPPVKSLRVTPAGGVVALLECAFLFAS